MRLQPALPFALRLFVTAAGTTYAACAHPAQETGTVSPAQIAASREPRELLPDEQIQHVLNRLAFGPRPGDVEKVRSMGVDAWIAQQLHPERIDDSRMQTVLASYPTLSTSTDQIVHSYQTVQQAQRAIARADSGNKKEARQEVNQDPALMQARREAQRAVGDMQSLMLARAVASDRQLDEVMVDFWENHFSVFAGKGVTRLYLPEYDQKVIRPNAMGKFRDLLEGVAKSPAMLFYLDNWQSAADSTHHTLVQGRGGRAGRGRGLPPAALPGRGRGLPPGIANLPPAAQERLRNATPEERQMLLQQLAQRPPQPRRGLNENYARELMELHTLGVDGGYSQKDVQEVARALTGWTFVRATGEFMFNPAIHDADEKTVLGHKLAAGRGIEDGEEVLDIVAKAPQTAHFIATKLARRFVSDVPPKALVDRCADTFQRTGGDIRETVGCVVTSPEFFSRTAYRSKVKTPFEVVASGLRAIGASPDTTPRSAQMVARLGQPIFGRQTPDGWPDRGDAWMNTGAILNRINFGLSLAAGQVPGARVAQWPEAATLRTQPRDKQVDGVIRALLGGQASTETRQVLMTGENPMLANAPRDTTMMQGPRPITLQGLPQIVGLALGAPEFQRR